MANERERDEGEERGIREVVEEMDDTCRGERDGRED